MVQGDEQPFFGASDLCDGRRLADHVLHHDGGLGRLAGHFVIVLQGHDEHRVRVLPEFHEVGHAADNAAVGSLAERRLVDRAVRGHEPVVGTDQFPACLVSARLGPAFVLRLQHAAGTVTQPDECREAFADQRAIGLQRRAAIDDGHALVRLATDR